MQFLFDPLKKQKLLIISKKGNVEIHLHRDHLAEIEKMSCENIFFLIFLFNNVVFKKWIITFED